MGEIVTFVFYVDTYKGIVDDEALFDKLNIQAEMAYDNYTRKHRLTEHYLKQDEKGAMAIRFSICEIIDNINYFNGLLESAKQTDLTSAKGIASNSVPSHSVTFTNDKTLKSIQINKDLLISNASIFNKYLSVYGLVYRGL